MNTVRRTFKTTKGTELTLLNLRGKEYLEVKNRLIWFREDHPDWGIETELANVTDVSAYAKAVVRDDKGRIIATSHKFETIQGFPDFIEKAETGAIGRALALIGYGTQFTADELDEGQRIVDSPVQPSKEKQQAPANPFKQQKKMDEAAAKDSGEYTFDFGKFKGKKVKEIKPVELNSWVAFMKGTGTLKPRAAAAVEHSEIYLSSLAVEEVPDEINEYNQEMPEEELPA